jgi:WhiB family redox-sensing transcriptional regulator
MIARSAVVPGGLGGLYPRAPTAEEVHWQLQGLCRQDDPRKWTPDPPAVELKSQEAKRICLDCPVMRQCREWALEHREQFGVWGGLTEGERDALWTQRRRKRREQLEIVPFYGTG